VKHATAQTLDGIGTLLDRIREFEALREKVRGVFYLKSRALLHFHEDGGSVYADVRLDGSDFERVCIDKPANQKQLIASIQRKLTAAGKYPTTRSAQSRVKSVPT
jgi:hypothetical protein